MKLQTIIFLGALLSTGLMAGIFFTWTNAVTPGLGKLVDIEYLKAFQAMNRSILNPTFFVIFWGAAAIPLLTTVISYKAQSGTVFWLLTAAVIIYVLGVVVVTMAGNIPLNNLLEQTNLEIASPTDMEALRNHFERPWNVLNWVRTFASTIAFILLLIASTLNKL